MKNGLLQVAHSNLIRVFGRTILFLNGLSRLPRTETILKGRRGRKEERKEGRKEKEGRKKGRKEGRKEVREYFFFLYSAANTSKGKEK